MGNLFVIDGTDGSGKQTQTEMLKDRLSKENISFKALSFPRYDNSSSTLVKMYLVGEFGQNAQDIDPKIASCFYAVDRFASYKQDFGEYYNNGGIVIADRYTTSNMIHQAGKIKDLQKRNEFLNWLWDFEFNAAGLPVPTEVFLLKMPPEKAIELMKERENKFTHEQNKDIHERDSNHIYDAYEAACYVANKYNWTQIECVENGQIRTREDVNEEIYRRVMEKIKLKEWENER